MRLGDGLDDQSLLIGQPEIAVDVAFRVDEDGLVGCLAADQVGVLRQAGVIDLVEMHAQVLLLSSDGGQAAARAWPPRFSSSHNVQGR